VVHEAYERDAGDHPANEYHIEEVGAVGKGVDDVAKDGTTVCQLETGIIATYGST
jgi:hypothetical protein